MEILEKYLDKQKFKSQLPLINYSPLSIIIPCFNEPNILETLDSIRDCTNYEESLLVIIVVNQTSSSTIESKELNKHSLIEIKQWIKNYETQLRRYFVVFKEFDDKIGGVGAARKLGMDEAINQYAFHNKNGLILSMDADTKCQKNYLSEIYKYFLKKPKSNCFIINYEHQLNNISSKQRDAIIQYELYLRYMYLSYKYIGHPHYFHTIGSSFGVSALAYAKQNGMNRRKAGEDFYFLQKVFLLGNCHEIKTTTVYPSSRTSNRVPFGTGKSISDIMEDKNVFKTYNFKAFEELKGLFDQIAIFYKISKDSYEEILYNKLGGLIKSWLIDNNFYKEIEQINKNCASEAMFKKKFYETFSILQIIKYLNFTHKYFIQKATIYHAVQCLPGLSTDNFNSPISLLENMRKEMLLTTQFE